MARILLAEDEPLLRELAIEDLTDAGYEVVAARDGDTALSMLREDTAFDLLFTDIRMPGATDGWALAEQAKRLIPGLKVIYSSGLGDPGTPMSSDERILVKPYRLDRLLQVLQELNVR